MLTKFLRLFTIKTQMEAFMIISALANGAVQRGSVYLQQFPGFAGKLMFLASTAAVLVAGAKILDCLRLERKLAAMREPAGEATRTSTELSPIKS